MTNFFKIFFTLISFNFLISCSQILQDVDLSFDKKDSAAQEEFTVVKKTLTLAEAKSRQTDPYIRSVIQKGLGKATLYPMAIRSDFPHPARSRIALERETH